METGNPNDENDKKKPGKSGPKINKKKLDRFLASICEAAGMTGKKPPKEKPADDAKSIACQAPCGKAEWRSHLDVPFGILCVSAAWSTNKKAHKHRDVTVAITYLNEDGKPDYADMVLCDSEMRWLMEALWHAPIWD